MKYLIVACPQKVRLRNFIVGFTNVISTCTLVQWNPIYTDTEGGFFIVSVLSGLPEKKNTPVTHFYRFTNQTTKLNLISHL